MQRHRSTTFEHTISGLLTKRADLFQEGANIRARLAEIRADIEAVDRALGICGYKGDLDAAMPRARREVAFAKGELTRGIFNELREAERPLTSRQIAERVSVMIRDEPADRRTLTALTRRVSKALRIQRIAGAVVMGKDASGNVVWSRTGGRL
jgi:hypothetical protein